MRKKNLLLALSLFATTSLTAQEQAPMVLQYDRPADFFEESLPIGNGKLGALVYGGTDARRSSMRTISSPTRCSTMCRGLTRNFSNPSARCISRTSDSEPSATIIVR